MTSENTEAPSAAVSTVDSADLRRLVDEQVAVALAPKPVVPARHPSGWPCATCGVSRATRWAIGPQHGDERTSDCGRCAAARDWSGDPEGQLDYLAYRLALVEPKRGDALVRGVAHHLNSTKGLSFRRAYETPEYRRLGKDDPEREPWGHVQAKGRLMAEAIRYRATNGDPIAGLTGRVIMSHVEPSPEAQQLARERAALVGRALADAWRVAQAQDGWLSKKAAAASTDAEKIAVLRDLAPERRAALRTHLQADEVQHPVHAGQATQRYPGHTPTTVRELFGEPARA